MGGMAARCGGGHRAKGEAFLSSALSEFAQARKEEEDNRKREREEDEKKGRKARKTAPLLCACPGCGAEGANGGAACFAADNQPGDPPCRQPLLARASLQAVAALRCRGCWGHKDKRQTLTSPTLYAPS